MTNEQNELMHAINSFPATFGLRAFPGLLFRIGIRQSYVSGLNVYLYTQVLRDGVWMDFAKGTPAELRGEVTAAPEPQTPAETFEVERNNWRRF